MKAISQKMTTSGRTSVNQASRKIIHLALFESQKQFAQTSCHDAPKGRFVTGDPAAPGIVEGKAVVVRRPAELSALETGDVLVCSTASPAITAMFATIGGLVCKTGGALAAAATVARESGIPAVVSAAACFETIKDGDLLRVDGAGGLVEILACANRQVG